MDNILIDAVRIKPRVRFSQHRQGGTNASTWALPQAVSMNRLSYLDSTFLIVNSLSSS